MCWEESGGLDDAQLSPSIAPALEVGLDVALSAAIALNVDVRWNALRTDVTSGGARLSTLAIDPLTLALGVAVRL